MLGDVSSRTDQLKRLLPFVSLGTATVSAVWMNRSPERAVVVVAAAFVAWAFVFVLAQRAGQPVDVTRRGERAKAFALLFVSQIAVQQALMFPLPFYLRAAVFHPRHAVFFIAYALAIVVALWDPLYARVAKRPALLALLSGFSAFAGLAMVLPVLSVPQRIALPIAGLGASIGVPLVMHRVSRPRPFVTAMSMGALVLLVRGLAFLIPPAPLELVSIGIGTDVVNRELVGRADRLQAPTALICHSAIKAPLGLRDALVHVWRKNGARVMEVPLRVDGGRTSGFRTWSKLSGRRQVAAGRYTCSAETSTGQVLSMATITVE
jgi:hypothetical protein